MILTFDIQSTTEHLESEAGLVLAGQIARFSGLTSVVRDTHSPLNMALVSMFGLLVQGRSSFEEIEQFRSSLFFKNAFDLPYVPAQETVRLHLEKYTDLPNCLDAIRACTTRLLKKATLTPIVVGGRKYLPVDCDVTTLDNSKSHKEGVSRTYMGTDGYAPIISYIGAEGYMLDYELRRGSQHCQNKTPEFLKRNIATIEQLPPLSPTIPLLFRLDSGNDAIDTIRSLVGKNRFFIIKRNRRKESTEEWLEKAQTFGTAHKRYPGVVEYTGSITKAHPKADADMPEFDIVFQVTERTMDREGFPLLVPEIIVETWWTNMFESPDDIIALYHDHATSEQFHSELKTDMDVERLPSGKMRVNDLILGLSMLAFNTLRFIGQSAFAKKNLLPPMTKAMEKRVRVRLRKVISDILTIGCKLVHHSRAWILRISESHPWLPVFRIIYADFVAL